MIIDFDCFINVSFRLFVVLRSLDGQYVTNGNFTVSPSGLFEAVGSVFDYRRLDSLVMNATGQYEQNIESVTEWITCMGPITEDIQLLVRHIVSI